MAQAVFSLIVPTRQRPASLQRLLTSLADTARRSADLEIILVVDADDKTSRGISFPRLPLRTVVATPGSTMGALNQAGYDASTGRWVMLLNDDVVVRTPDWDVQVAEVCSGLPDDLFLIHVNDTLFQDKLCTFPLVSRIFCQLAGGICPPAYRRFRIDDHIEDVFNLLGLLGERRNIYLPEVVFEHQNFVTNATGVRHYYSDPAILAQDAPRFDALRPSRIEIALKLRESIDSQALPKEKNRWREILEKAPSAEGLRIPQRLRIRYRHNHFLRKMQACLANGGLRNLAQAIGRRIRERQIPIPARFLPPEE